MTIPPTVTSFNSRYIDDIATALRRIQDETAQILNELIPPGTPVALLDFPNHKNAGDSLIFRGELEYIERLGLHLRYVADSTRYDKRDLDHFIGPDGVVLIHGGGNFGDRWVEAQAFHERTIDENHDHRIVQLPQGIEFREGLALKRAQSVYRAHPHLTVLIRDRKGVEVASDYFSDTDVKFSPDMAFGNGFFFSAREPTTTVIYIRRTDSEAKLGSTVTVDSSIPHLVDDWSLTRFGELQWLLYHVPGALARRIPAVRRPLYETQLRCYFATIDLNLRSAIGILSKGRVVLTDRLHAAVLGALLAKPVIALDNANGKVSAIYRDYLHTLPNVRFATSAEHANELLREIVTPAGGSELGAK